MRNSDIDEITISVFTTSEGEYQYDIYNGSVQDAADGEPEDGGLCTSNMTNAIDMACGQAKDLVIQDEKSLSSKRNELKNLRSSNDQNRNNVIQR